MLKQSGAKTHLESGVHKNIFRNVLSEESNVDGQSRDFSDGTYRIETKKFKKHKKSEII